MPILTTLPKPIDPKTGLQSDTGVTPGLPTTPGRKKRPIGFSTNTPEQLDPFAVVASHPGLDLSEYDRNWIYGGDNDFVRAAEQGLVEQVASRAATFLPHVLGGIISGLGTIGDLEAWQSMISGKGGDFANPVTRMGDAISEGADTAYGMADLRVFQERPNAKPLDQLGDAAFWLNNATNLVESIGEFAALGMGIGGIVSKGAKGLASVVGATAKFDSLILGAGDLVTSAALTYVEGAQEGANVYKTVLKREMDRSLGNGMTDVERETRAKEIASESAASTVRWNMVNTAWNFTAVRSLFRRPSLMGAAEKQGFLREGVEDAVEQSARIAAAPVVHANRAAKLGLESGQEALEEVINEVASKQGEGSQDSEDTRTGGERLVDTLMTQETAMAAILGAIGGVGQTAIMEGAPLHSVEGQGTGKGRQSMWTIERHEVEEAVNRQRTAMVESLDGYAQATKDLQEAAAMGDTHEANLKAQDAKDRLFKISTADSITGGGDIALRSFYNDLAKMSPEEARAQGFDEDTQEQAADKVKQIDHLVKQYEKLQIQLGFTQDERLSGLPMYAFQLYTAAHVEKENIKRLAKKYAEANSEIDTNVNDFGIGISADTVSKAKVTAEASQLGADHLIATIAEIQQKADDPEYMNSIRSRFGISSESTQEIIDHLHRRAKDLLVVKEEALNRIKEAKKSFMEKALEFGTEGFSDETIQGVWEDVLARNSEIESVTVPIQEQIFVSENRRDWYTKKYDELMSRKGRKAVIEQWKKNSEESLMVQKASYMAKIRAATTIEELNAIKEDAYDAIKGEQGDAVREAIDSKEASLSMNSNADAALKAKAEALATPTPPAANPAAPTDPNAPPSGENPAAPSAAALGEETDTGSTPGRPKLTGEDRETVRKQIQKQPDKASLNNYVELIIAKYDMAEDAEFVQWFVDRSDSLEAAEKRNAEKPKTDEDEDEGRKPATGSDGNDDQDPYTTNSTDSPEGVQKQVNAIGSTKDESGIGPEGKKLRQAFLIVEGGHSIAYLSTEFQEDALGKITASNDRVGGVTPPAEVSSLLLPGDELIISIDDAFDGLVYENGEKVRKTAAQIERESGRVNMPMKIEHIHPATGERMLVGWVHDIDWVDAVSSRGGPDNVALKANGIDNWAEQKRIIRELRESIASNPKGTVTTRVTGKGAGQLSRYVQLDSLGNPVRTEGGKVKREMRPGTELLPDPDLEFYVVRNGELQTSRGVPAPNAVNTSKLLSAATAVEGHAGIIVTMADGTKLAVPVWVKQVTHEDAVIMFSAINAFESRQKDVFTYENTGVNFSRADNPHALFSVLTRYAGSYSFDHSTLQSPDQDLDKPRVWFHVSEGDQFGVVDIGIEGSDVIFTTNKNKADNEEGYSYLLNHEAEVVALLEKLYYNVDLSMLNKSKGFIVPRITENGIEGVEYTNYNDLLKERIQTDIDGRHQGIGRDGTPEYTYAQQPTIVFATEPVGVKAATPPVNEGNKADFIPPPAILSPALAAAAAAAARAASAAAPAPSAPAAPTTAPVTGRPVATDEWQAFDPKVDVLPNGVETRGTGTGKPEFRRDPKAVGQTAPAAPAAPAPFSFDTNDDGTPYVSPRAAFEEAQAEFNRQEAAGFATPYARLQAQRIVDAAEAAMNDSKFASLLANPPSFITLKNDILIGDGIPAGTIVMVDETKVVGGKVYYRVDDSDPNYKRLNFADHFTDGKTWVFGSDFNIAEGPGATDIAEDTVGIDPPLNEEEQVAPAPTPSIVDNSDPDSREQADADFFDSMVPDPPEGGTEFDRFDSPTTAIPSYTPPLSEAQREETEEVMREMEEDGQLTRACRRI